MTRVWTAIAVGLALWISAGAVAAQKISLMNPAAFKDEAPPTYNVRFDTSAGVFVVKVTRDWAPKAADRFYSLVKNGFYDGIRFHRAVPNFMTQFGVHGNPTVANIWSRASFTPDPVKHGNKRMTLTFAMGGKPSTATTQVFINARDNSNLDGQGFAAFGEVVEGQDVAGKLFNGYGDAPSRGGQGPDNARMAKEGNAYLEKEFPKLDYIKAATLEP
ncbi:MAG: peptidylprolyl isomerase [Acidobacteriota bacterium]|nr:peptidylprolyl isomerase [Acidobacteriota bacterium]